MDGVSVSPRMTVKCQKDIKVTIMGEALYIASNMTCKERISGERYDAIFTYFNSVAQFLRVQFLLANSMNFGFKAALPCHKLCERSKHAERTCV